MIFEMKWICLEFNDLEWICTIITYNLHNSSSRMYAQLLLVLVLNYNNIQWKADRKSAKRSCWRIHWYSRTWLYIVSDVKCHQSISHNLNTSSWWKKTSRTTDHNNDFTMIKTKAKWKHTRLNIVDKHLKLSFDTRCYTKCMLCVLIIHVFIRKYFSGIFGR